MATRRHYSRGRRFRRSHRAGVGTRGIIPTTLGVLAATVPFTLTGMGRGNSFVQDIGLWMQGDNSLTITDGFQDLYGGLVGNVGTMAGLIAGAVATGWAAKKLGLRSATKVTKKWSVV